MYQCKKENKFFTSVWRRLGFVQVCGEDWFLHQFVGEIEFCKSVWRGLGSCTSVWGDWVLYKCVHGGDWVLYKYGRRFGVFTTVWRRLGFVEGIRFCTSVWRRLGSVPVCGGYLVSKTSKTWFCTSV